MRARNIKPGFYKDENLVECSFAARLLSPGLWMMADRNGYLEDRPYKFKMEILPADSIEVEPLLQELHDSGHIIRYEVDGKRYIFIPGFKEHQSPHHKEKARDIPPCEADKNRTKKPTEEDKPETGPGPAPDQPSKGACQPPLKEERGMMNDDISSFHSEGACEEKAETKPKKPKIDYTPDFETFWQTYPPNGASKHSAFEKYLNAIKHAPPDQIMQGVVTYRDYVEKCEVKVAHATTWLNQQRWTVNYNQLLENSNAHQHTTGPSPSKLHTAAEGIAAAAAAREQGEPNPFG